MNAFLDLMEKIDRLSSIDFMVASAEIIRFVEQCPNFLGILNEIGTIPESLEHDSTQEKLFSKASDAVLARAFRELGLKATVLRERGDSADVQAESYFHGYTLVADAKAFRLSRTAKNQKDFKVIALSGWKKDADYAVLCSPYYQYPANKSQIYAQAVDANVCLLSWEHLAFLIQHGIKETDMQSFAPLWNVSGVYAEHCVIAEKKNCFIPEIDETVRALSDKRSEDFPTFLSLRRDQIIKRAENELSFWKNELKKISNYSKEQAITELIRAKKIDEKMAQIEKYTSGFQRYDR